VAAKQAYLDHLRAIDLFDGCSTRSLEKVARAGDEITLASGSLIVDQGQTGKEAFILLEGTATVRRNGKKVADLEPGAMIGELSLLDHGPRTASVIATSDCRLFVLEQRRFLAVIDEVPALAHRLLSALAGRIRELDRQYYG
jgi:CRP/FNR family cyclic AMP-dependent transcriptional regulator